MFPLVAEVTAITDQLLSLRTKAGKRLVGLMHGFPPGFTPRVGDLVGIAQRDSAGRTIPPSSQLSSAPLCLPVSPPSEPGTNYQLSAVPLSTWRSGVPAVNRDGGLMIQGITLIESAAVREAAMQGRGIAVATLDSTLDKLQVLTTRG
jgi:hypothetical protein